MDREQALAILRAHEDELREAGIVRLSLFGSTARGEAGPDSDVDLAVRLSENFSCGGFDYFGRLEELEQRLSRMLGCEVDVVEEPVRRDRFQKQIEREGVLAF
jgi:predicted nucleotidyltransferase